MKIKGWDKTVESDNVIVWESGPKPNNPLHIRDKFVALEKTTPYIENTFGDVWNVRSSNRINPNTLDGRVMSFKTKEMALKFAYAYMRRNP
jgi:hypothetical protein